MNLKRVIGTLTTAVILLAVISGLSWFTMGKRTVTQSNTQPRFVKSVRRVHPHPAPAE